MKYTVTKNCRYTMCSAAVAGVNAALNDRRRSKHAPTAPQYWTKQNTTVSDWRLDDYSLLSCIIH